MATSKIGNREVVFSQAFLFSSSTPAEINVKVDELDMKIVIELSSEKVQEPSASWQYDPTIAGVRVKFLGWESRTGAAMLEPKLIANLDKANVFFQVAHAKIGSLDLMHFQLLKETR